MVKKTTDFDEFIVATILADIFDPSGSDDFDLISRKIVDGFESNRIIKSHALDNKEGLAA